MRTLTLFTLLLLGTGRLSAQQAPLPLDGAWETGTDRRYTATTSVPGIATDPTRKNDGRLWYRRTVDLPRGAWSTATLELRGARFRPEVFIDGQSVSHTEGGMAPTFHPLKSPRVKPGRTVTLEIALASLADVPTQDASYIPVADQWRSNNSSGLWDDVILHFHYAAKIGRVVLFPDLSKKEVRVDFNVEGLAKPLGGGRGTLVVTGEDGKTRVEKPFAYTPGNNSVTFAYGGTLDEWSPEHPNLYRMELRLDTRDSYEMPFGIKDFRIENKQFRLNDKPCPLRGSTVVWHRWVRSDEGAALGYDTTWFRDNVVLRLKEHGANLLRFHLGVPPQRLLDLCDRYGLIVQYEWSFFHGMPASEQSCTEQYGEWLAAAVKHPSICIYHPYNETEGDALQRVWNALDRHLPHYPPLVISERDVLHLHKYWWSIFENVGMFYDSYEQFDRPIIVDEFGGNYLDGAGNPGGYVTLAETFLRFLGRDHTADMRLKLQEYSHGRIAEYWRRIGAAGAAPFPIASSWEDGNHWFLGPLAEGRPKPVWNSLTAAWSPRSVSTELWDRNFIPGQTVTFPLWWFNDTNTTATLEARITVEDAFGKVYDEHTATCTLEPWARSTRQQSATLPGRTGEFILKAELTEGRTPEVKYPVVSKWDLRTFRPIVTDGMTSRPVYIPSDEKELRAFAADNGLRVCDDPATASCLLFSRTTWKRIAAGESAPGEILRCAVERGASAVLLDVGDIALGQGYPRPGDDASVWGPLQGVVNIVNPATKSYELFSGVKLTFSEAAEPESFLFPAPGDKGLWRHLPAGYSGLWNGYRGGLIVPAYDMAVSGLSARSVIEQWAARGADRERLTSGRPYYAYELYGFYAFSDRSHDKAVEEQLRQRVQFLIEDAPALAVVMNTATPVTVTDLARSFEQAKEGVAETLDILTNAGKNLTRTPVLAIGFGPGKGRLIVSQLLTEGRLSPGFGSDGLYGVRYDATAVQMVLNMLQEQPKTQKP